MGYSILGFYWDNGKENGNYYSNNRVILGILRDNGKENGSSAPMEEGDKQLALKKQAVLTTLLIFFLQIRLHGVS